MHGELPERPRSDIYELTRGQSRVIEYILLSGDGIAIQGDDPVARLKGCDSTIRVANLGRR